MALGYAELLVASNDLDLILNGLVSSISGIIPGSASGSASIIENEGLQKLTTLNILCEADETFWSRIKELRIVMILRAVFNWPTIVKDSPTSWIISTEILRLQRSLLPWIKHLDGDFWEKGMSLLKSSLEVFNSVSLLISRCVVMRQWPACRSNMHL